MSKELILYGLKTEHRKIGGNILLSKDLALHMAEHQMGGAIAIITDRPLPLMGATRKQWLKILRRAERDYASTLNKQRRQEITRYIWYMKDTSFTAEDPANDPIANVCFATAEQFLFAPPTCQVLYLASKTTKEMQHMLTSWMPPSGLVVIYES